MTKVRLKRVQRRFNDIFDEPFGEKRQDNRTQEQKDKEAKDEAGIPVSAGRYIYELRSGSYSVIQKMVLLK